MKERDEAIESADCLIRRIAYRHLRFYGGDPNELRQECIAHLCQIWPQYDASRATFEAFVQMACPRHLKQTYALGRLDGPTVRVPLSAFNRGERTRVVSIAAVNNGDGFDIPHRQQRVLPDEDAFVRYAEMLVGRKLKPIERRVLVRRFVEESKFADIAEQYPRQMKTKLKYLFVKFASEVRRRRKKQGCTA